MADYERTQAYREKLRNGEFDLEWMQARSEWGMRATPSKRGLTLNDINVGSYGVIPEEVPDSRCFAPRGADFNAAEMPSMGYSLNTRAEAWAENMGTLYEEAVARQWSSTRDIPWHTLQPLPKDIEHAMCQLCTFFTEVEFIAGDVPGWWLSQINAAYHETKLFMATQIMDEARHLEVFRKRALANGGGLGKCPPEVEEGLKYIFDLRSFPQMLARLHLFGEGRVLTLFRLGELIAQHGSWNRSKKIGYRVMRVQLEGERVLEYTAFAAGWLQGEKAWGRPVDVQVMPDGALLVSDDYAGAIYRISYQK